MATANEAPSPDDRGMPAGRASGRLTESRGKPVNRTSRLHLPSGNNTAGMQPGPEPDTGEVADPVSAWLDWQCRMISGVVAAFILVRFTEGDQWAAQAAWPSYTSPDNRIRSLADRATAEQRRLLYQLRRARGAAEDEDLIACPQIGEDGATTVVLLRLKPRNDLQLRAVANLLEWGLHWLTTSTPHGAETLDASGTEFAQVVSGALSAPDLDHAVEVICEWVASAFSYERVSIGLRRGLVIRYAGTRAGLEVSFGSSLANDLEAAMTEAADHEREGTFPKDGLPDLAHRKLVQRHGMASAESWLLRHNGSVIGVITGERVATIQTVPSDRLSTWLPALAAALSVLARRERMLTFRLARHLPTTRRNRWIATAIFAAALVTGAWPVTMTVTSPAGIEGREQRAIVAPVDGYLASTVARAGDDIRSGAILATLDDHDLQIERTRWASERERHAGEYTDALTRRDRATASGARNRMMQAQAELDLVEQKLERMQLRSPFEGVVVHGDFSQLLGTPIERGQVLFEIAPIARYHAIARVDERDIGQVSTGSTGRLRLSAIPQREFTLVVSRIEPVATAENGRNYFRVEATLEEDPSLIRPGMAGIAQFDAGTAPLAWSWLHSTVSGIRLWFWRAGIF